MLFNHLSSSIAVMLAFFVTVPIQIFLIKQADATVYLRGRNERGPTAIESGVKCIKSISRLYFYNNVSTQVPNLAVMHLPNMSSPASEIFEEFLTLLHKEMMSDGQKMKIRVYAVERNTRRLSVSLIERVLLTPIDYYVLVIDDYSVVSSLISLKSLI